MLKNSMLYHNAAELKKTAYGDKLYRFPTEVITHLNERARLMAEYACGCELRFVTEAKRIHINLSVQGGGIILAVIFRGDYVHDVVRLEPGKFTMLEICDNGISDSDKEIFFKNNDFAPNVWRVHFHNCICTVESIDTMGYEVRPPHKNEMPDKTMLAYGSSITHGARAVTHTNSYVNEAGRILGIDILNKGVGGSCYFEPEAADYFASDNSWDFAWIEGAVNSTCFSSEEFDRRFSYFVDTLYKTGKKLFLTTIFPASAALNENSDDYKKVHEFDDIIRSKKDKAVIIEGKDILTDLRFLTTDLIHPSNEGHTRMGIRLADILKEYIR